MKADHQSRELTIEVVVGVFMIMVLLGLGYFTIILSGEKLFVKKYRLEACFESVMGLRDGDNVVVRGMPVGKVKELDLAPDGVHVIMELDHPVEIRNKYRMTVSATSMLGGRYLYIWQGPENEQKLNTDQVFDGEEPHDFLADMSELVDDLKSQLSGEGGIIGDIKKFSSTLGSVADQINAGEGTLAKLLSRDDVLYRDIAASAASLKNITGSIDRGEGLIGKAIKDDALYGDLQATLNEAKAALDDFREITPVLTFTSILFGAL